MMPPPDATQTLDPAVDTAPQVSQDNETAVQTSAPAFERLSDHERMQILRMAAEGFTQRQIAAAIECSQPTVGYTLRAFKTALPDVQTLMKADAVSQLTHWRKASAKAADRGDHRPAREFIEAAFPELRPQQSGGGAGVGVIVNIGMPGQPIDAPKIEDFRPINQVLIGESLQIPSANAPESHNAGYVNVSDDEPK